MLGRPGAPAELQAYCLEAGRRRVELEQDHRRRHGGLRDRQPLGTGTGESNEIQPMVSWATARRTTTPPAAPIYAKGGAGTVNWLGRGGITTGRRPRSGASVGSESGVSVGSGSGMGPGSGVPAAMWSCSAWRMSISRRQVPRTSSWLVVDASSAAVAPDEPRRPTGARCFGPPGTNRSAPSWPGRPYGPATGRRPPGGYRRSQFRK